MKIPIEYTDKEGVTKVKQHEIRFLVSLKFLPKSLDELVSISPTESMSNLSKYFDGEKLELVSKKGIFPYEWFGQLEKLNETKLPSQTEFYSNFKCSGIDEEDYPRSINVWETFGMKTFKAYHDLYNMTDVLLLADAF